MATESGEDKFGKETMTVALDDITLTDDRPETTCMVEASEMSVMEVGDAVTDHRDGQRLVTRRTGAERGTREAR